MSIFMLARLQLDQLVSLLEKEFEIPVRALSGAEVSRRLTLAVGDMNDLTAQIDRTYEVTCLGEAVDLWRALVHDADSVVGHAFEVDGSITLTLGPDLPDLPALGIRASDGGELNASPTDVLGAASSCIRDAAELVAIRDRGREELAAARRSTPLATSTPVVPHTTLVAAVADHFSIWSWGSERALVEWAIGLLPHPDDHAAEAKASAYLMSLWALHLELAAYAGEGSPGDWRYEIGQWVNDGMSVEQLLILNQVDELGWELEDGEFEASLAEVCVGVVEHYSRDVGEAILKDLGDAYTFAYFWATRYADVNYPLSAELVGEIVNDESVLEEDPQNKLPAFNWVQSGMNL